MILYSVVERIGLRRFLIALYRVQVSGAERIPESGPCILAANHESLIDPFVLGLATRRPIRYMAKAELFRYPGLRAVMKGFGTFPVDRRARDEEAIDTADRLLAEGQVLGIFPQGTCLPYRRRPFRRGAARLALAAGCPLVPVGLVNTEKALRPKRIHIGLPHISILVGEPLAIEPGRPTPEAAGAVTARLEQAIVDLLRHFPPPAHAWID